ncbi:MAG TPA: glycosyltransferase family A protein, partial [Flavobacterium sp.]
MPYFSVIIPLYNKENFIGKTIESVLAQTFADFEIIIVDDCSTDNSLAKAKEYISEKIRIVHHESNKGLSASRNTGIKNAATEFITFLDADDLWKPTFLEKIRELTLKFPQADLFATSYMELYPGNLEIAPSVNKSDIPPGDMVLVNDFFRKNLRQPIYNHSSVCIRRTLFEQVGNYDERINFSEDVDFNIRANAEGLLAFYNSVESYYVVYSENQITTSGIINKTIPMLDGFSRLENENPDI